MTSVWLSSGSAQRGWCTMQTKRNTQQKHGWPKPKNIKRTASGILENNGTHFFVSICRCSRDFTLSHLCLLWWSWFINARCFFQLTKTRKNHWNRRDMVVLTIEEQIPTYKLSTRFFKFLMVLLWIIYSNMKTFTLHFIFGNHFIHSHDLCVLWGSVIVGHYWEGIKNFAGDYQSNSAQHSMTTIKTFVCSKITVCRRCIIAVSWSENRADVKI